jgi:hypothetical protein
VARQQKVYFPAPVGIQTAGTIIFSAIITSKNNPSKIQQPFLNTILTMLFGDA